MSTKDDLFSIKYGRFEAKAQGRFTIVVIVVVVGAAMAAKVAGLW